MAGNFGNELVDRIGVDHGSSWIVRIRQENNTCIFIDRFENRGQVKRVVAHGSLNQLRPGRVHSH